MSLVEYAKSELKLAGLFDKDSDYGGMLGDAVLKMVEQFADEGHSGMSAAMALAIFRKVANYEPLTPLTGNNDEWMQVGSEMYQNRRSPRVFKKVKSGEALELGEAYDIEGKVFVEPNGMSYTNAESHVPVTFPYVPKTEYVHVDAPSDNN